MEITTKLVRQLIDTQFPAWKGFAVYPVARSGHDHRTFHLGDKMTVRLPSRPEYVAQIEKEAVWLPFLQKNLSFPISSPIALGAPANGCPFPWSVNRYIQGETAAEALIPHPERFAAELSMSVDRARGWAL